LRKAVSHNQACIKLISKPGLLKVLEHFKPSSKSEWKEVMNILQEVASRIPLLHRAISRETVENIIQLLSHFSQTKYSSNGMFRLSINHCDFQQSTPDSIGTKTIFTDHLGFFFTYSSGIGGQLIGHSQSFIGLFFVLGPRQSASNHSRSE
jgi:hypothetical protein